MNETLRLSLLGLPLIQLDDAPLDGLSPQKVKALLFYLAYTGQPQPRELLADLFFDDRTPKQAAANLRAMISRLRRKLAPFIVADRDTVALNGGADVWLDTAVLTPALQSAQQQLGQRGSLTSETAAALAAALKLVRGDFLAGFHLRGARNFDEWLLLERERWHHQIAAARQALVVYHLRRREYAAGIAQARRLLRQDNLQEAAHRQLMLLLARSGDRSAALAQYKACRQILTQELGVEPMAETTALAERIRGMETAVPHRIPVQSTPFIGRADELARISQYLDDPNCRLLTLVGTGGIGKTRLALQAAENQRRAFLNGVHFIPLAAVGEPDALVFAIADGLRFSFYSQEPPPSQLLSYLREKELLLVLDNFEHLLDGAKLVADILQAAPQVKILVTSRERLNLRWEWLLDVRGLPYPPETGAARENDAGAMQLFAQSAARVRPDFSMAADRANAARICRLVEGMPLAIELAAAGLRSRSSREIAAEIERNLDLLATAMRDAPARHRSVRAAFDSSWQSLTPAERDAFCRLSVFRGGFSYEAAWQITGASRAALDALTAKSLLRQSASGRYGMHNLLRQYAAEALASSPRQRETLSRHSAYFAAFLRQRENALRGERQKETLAEIGKEIENVRAAWRVALAECDCTAVAQSLEGLFRFYDIRSWLQEGKDAFERAATALRGKSGDEVLLAKTLARQGSFCFRLGLYEQARELAQESAALLRRRGEGREEAFALQILGATADERGDYAAARTHFQASQTLYQAAGDRWGMAAAHEHLGDVARMVGDYETARREYEQSQALFQAIGDRDRIAGAFNSLGSIAGTQGDYERAQGYFEQSLAVCRELGDRFGIVSASHNLSNVAYLQGDYERAKQLREETLRLCREIGFRWGVASTLRHLGDAHRRLGAYDEARRLYEEGLTLQSEIGHQRDVALTLDSLGSLAQAAGERAEARAYYRQALQTAMEIESPPVALAILQGWGELLAQEGKPAQALELLTFVFHHPAAESQTQAGIGRLLDDLKSQLSPQEATTAVAQGEALTLAAAAKLLA